MTLIGPFSHLLTMRGLPACGPINDSALEVISDAGILADQGRVAAIDRYDRLEGREKIVFDRPVAAIPSLIDAHTHLCWGGSRAADYALRVQGVSYQEIARQGGGILDTVSKTRGASLESLEEIVRRHLKQQLAWGIATTEVKTGYGLTVEQELKMLQAIRQGAKEQPVRVVPTCLAAHLCPPEFPNAVEYLETIQKELFPLLKPYTHRVDIFIEEGAFSKEEALPYLQAAKKGGFQIVVHANQFTHAGASVAAQIGAISADHLEHVTEEELKQLKRSGTAAIVLPGASLGLGMEMAPARKMLDVGLSVAIASDWNPGSAPMGNLLLQAAVLGANEKLSLAETLAGVTFRAAAALGLKNRGVIEKGNFCDLAVYPTDDWREILYYQGSLLLSHSIIGGVCHVVGTQR